MKREEGGGSLLLDLSSILDHERMNSDPLKVYRPGGQRKEEERKKEKNVWCSGTHPFGM